VWNFYPMLPCIARMPVPRSVGILNAAKLPSIGEAVDTLSSLTLVPKLCPWQNTMFRFLCRLLAGFMLTG